MSNSCCVSKSFGIDSNKIRRILVVEENTSSTAHFLARNINLSNISQWFLWTKENYKELDMHDFLHKHFDGRKSASVVVIFDHVFPTSTLVQNMLARQGNIIAFFSCSRLSDIPLGFRQCSIDYFVFSKSSEKTDLQKNLQSFLTEEEENEFLAMFQNIGQNLLLFDNISRTHPFRLFSHEIFCHEKFGSQSYTPDKPMCNGKGKVWPKLK